MIPTNSTKLSDFAPKCWKCRLPTPFLPVNLSLSSNQHLTIRPSSKQIHANNIMETFSYLESRKLRPISPRNSLLHTLGWAYRFTQFRTHLMRRIHQFLFLEDDPTLYKELFGSALHLGCDGRRIPLSGRKTQDNLTTLFKEALTPSSSQSCLLWLVDWKWELAKAGRTSVTCFPVDMPSTFLWFFDILDLKTGKVLSDTCCKRNLLWIVLFLIVN